ncbi:MAG: hypothetical protein EA397_20295, partial [Deltaproteobacteria bacterium]
MSLTLALSLLISWADDLERPEPDPTGECSPLSSAVTDGPTLQAAIVGASHDDVICIPDGIYSLDSGFTIDGKSIVLRGEGPSPDDVVLDKASSGGNSVLSINAPGARVTLENLTIDGKENARCIEVNNGDLALVNARILNGRRNGEGVGVRLYADSSLHVFNSNFQNNRASGSSHPQGGHILLYGGASAELIVVRSTFSEGFNGRGGAIAFGRSTDEGRVEVYDSTFVDNTTEGNDDTGGHINVNGANVSLLVVESSFEGGRARRGGAIGLNGGHLRVISSEFSDNRAHHSGSDDKVDPYGGGAIALVNATGLIERSTFYESSSYNTGGSILVHGSSAELELYESDFHFGEAEALGGHVAVVGGADLFARQNRFFGGEGTGGGGVGCYESTCEIEHSGFWWGWSDREPAMGSDVRGGGGVMAYDSSEITLTRNLFCGNEANPGAGAVQWAGGGAANLRSSPSTLRNNVYVGNESTYSGGALYLRGPGVVTSQYETFVGNRADLGCTVYGLDASHDLRNNLYTQSTCDLGEGPTFDNLGFILHARQSGDLVARFSFHFDSFVQGVANGNVDISAVSETNPELPPIDLPMSRSETCRELYDFVPDEEHPLSVVPYGATHGPAPDFIDEDHDGVSWLFDCDDTDEGAGARQMLWPDNDGDEFGDANHPGVLACQDGFFATWVPNNLDCDDMDPEINPNADERCDSVDRNCDGSTTDNAVDADDWFPDMDNDSWGFAYPGAPYNECDPPEGILVDGDPVEHWVTRGGDCDDDDLSVFPGAPELCDGQYNNCLTEGYAKPGAPPAEQDRDKDSYVECDFTGGRWITSTTPRPEEGQDCDDGDKSVYPGAPEICDGQFNDCDDPDYELQDAPDLELDRDDDTYVACDLDVDLEDWEGKSTVKDGGDCDDDDKTIYPGADEEPYDRIDQDCDGFDLVDIDNDLYPGILRSEWEAIEVEGDPAGWPEGVFDEPLDCDDENPAVNPGEPEIWYDGIDQNCDQWSDFDPDRDGSIWPDYVEREAAFFEAIEGEHTPSEPNDCYDGDDTQLSARAGWDTDGDYTWDPGAELVPIEPNQLPRETSTWYNGIDDECRYMQDDGSGPTVEIVNDFDKDGDGYMHPDFEDAFVEWVARYTSFERADHPMGPPPLGSTPIAEAFFAEFGPDEAAWRDYFDEWGRDCDDDDANIFPGADEIPYDRIDQNCDGFDLVDADGDDYPGILRSEWEAIEVEGDPAGWPEDLLNEEWDCDDDDPTINPSAEDEPYDRIDQNCDTFDLVDIDNDKYPGILRSDWELQDVGDSPAGAWPEGVFDEPLDCDDTEAEINPGADEIPGDGVDQNCSGTELCYVDADGDGFRTQDTLESADGDLSCEGEGLALAAVPAGDCDD